MAYAPKDVQKAATYVVDHFADAVKHLEKLLYQNIYGIKKFFLSLLRAVIILNQKISLVSWYNK